MKQIPKERSYLAANIRFLRLQNHLTQTELANKLGVKQTTISECERGTREPKTIWLLNTICEQFEVGFDEILKEDLSDPKK